MASTPTSILRLEIQAAGDNDSTWGDRANTVFQLLEDAIAKRTSIVLAGSDVTLTALNYASDQSRSLALNFTGTLSANVNVIVPAKSKMYLVTNNATVGPYTVTVKTSAGSGVVVTGTGVTLVYCDGTDVISMNDSSGLYATLAGRNSYTAGNADVIDTYTGASTITVDCALTNAARVVLDGNRTLALTNPRDGSWLDLYVVQNAVGGYALTWPTITWIPGSAPVANVDPNSVTRVWLRYYEAGAVWYGDYTSVPISSSGSTVNITQAASQFDVDLFTLAGRPSGIVTVSYTIPSGVILRASNPMDAALSLAGFASGSTINITNNGYILGAGGDGGNGGSVSCAGGNTESTLDTTVAMPGEAGGNAILGAGSGVTVNITNASGFIWGGGGGGGGGGATGDLSNANAVGSGGGGGAGVGGARGGKPVTLSNDVYKTTPTAGGNSGGGISATAGAGGTASALGGAATGGAGGAGGDWGTAGSAGVSPTTETYDVAGGAAGAAGKAVSLNSSTVNILSGSGSPNVKGAVA